MSADGKWTMTLNSAMGAQEMTAEFATDGATLSGSISNPMMGSMDVAEGKVDGDSLSWKVSLTQPMPMTLDFSAKIDGDELTGEADLGTYGKAPITGKRA